MIHRLNLRVRYAETDQMGVVYHGQYLTWMDVARTELLRDLGFSYKEMEAAGTFLVVVGTQLKFQHPARFDDEIEILTRVSLVKRFKLGFEYQIYRQTDWVKLVDSSVVLGSVDSESQPREIEPKIRKALEDVQTKSFDV